jgi:steroid delta-isomerase-like uncharacterized protein
MTSEDIATALRFHGDIFSAGRHAAAGEILSDRFQWHNDHLPEQYRTSVEGVVEFARALRAAYPDYELLHRDTAADGGRVAVRWEFTGTNHGELLGVPATGRRVRVSGIDWFHVADGRITEMWQEFDVMGWMQQLGVIPAPGGA